MKPEIRIIGLDDMPFSFEDSSTDVIGVVMRGGCYVEGVLRGTITVDGTDASRVIARMISQSKHSSQLRAIMIDGGALGGFNVVDGSYLYDATSIPVMTVTAHKPDPKSMESALRQHFDDWQDRWTVMNHGTLHVVSLRYPLYIKPFGIDIKKATKIIQGSIVRGAIPEPIRLAHLIATGIHTSNSNTKD